MRRRWLWLAMLAIAPLACSRTWWRQDADRETYATLAEKLNDPRWLLPRIDVEPSPEARFFDPTSPDYPPRPPDDPAAHQYMLRADGHRGWPYWDRNGVLPSIEFPGWRASLPLDADGKLKLTQDGAVLLAQIHSRRFQTQIEDLYLTALVLTLNRFDFAMQWFATNRTDYTHFGAGSVPTETNTLTTTTNVGFTKAFTAGGQFAIDFLNSFTWEYTGKTNTVNSNIGIAFIQPLLRNAGRQVRMEGLTQGERNLLYAVRTFARFRKEFYFEIAVDQYLNLLEATQRIRNLEQNVKTLEQNYRLIEALTSAGQATSVQEDQTFTQWQAALIALQQAKTGLENQFDAYKLLLGLPPEVPIELDVSLLTPFQLVSPELAAHQEAVSQFINAASRRDPPGSVAELRQEYERLAALRDTSAKLAKEIAGEVYKLGKMKPAVDAGEATRRRQAAVEQLKRQSAEVTADLEKFKGDLAAMAGRVNEATRKGSQTDLWIRSRDLSNLVSQLFVVQTQARVYLLELPKNEVKQDQAIQTALAERLDLMNARAAVTDSWRQVEVAANKLKGLLTVTGNADVATAFDAANAFDFSAQASSYRVGLLWETPLNRQAERNAYRQVLINYQRQRRAFMLAEDEIVRTLRTELRQLDTDQQNFEITRQALIATARQVEEVQYKLLFAEKGSTPTDTIIILQAFDRLLEAQNALIRQYFSYERGRIRLLLDMEQLQLDDDGVYRDASKPGPGPAPGGAGPGNAGQPGAGLGGPDPERLAAPQPARPVRPDVGPGLAGAAPPQKP